MLVRKKYSWNLSDHKGILPPLLGRGGVGLLALVGVVGVVCVVLLYTCSAVEVKEGNDEKTELSPTMLTSMAQIGQWEFLSVSDEELVDTTARTLFGEKQLTRIYYGTLHLGVDMHAADKDWVKVYGDSVSVLLPPVKLLDENFIDEARTQSFFETGSWSEADRAALLQKAKRQMKQRCLSQSNLQSARANATARTTQIFRALGYKSVTVRIKN